MGLKGKTETLVDDNRSSRGSLRGAVPLAHHFLRERVREGDLALDATCGNGQDTLLLAQLVGEKGRVFAFDVQDSAIAATAKLLEEHGVRSRVELIQSGHERLHEHLFRPVKGAVFNLGYLPGGDSSLATRPATTVSALDQGAKLLDRGGIIVICVYTGHPGGEEEASAVRQWCASLSPREFNSWCSRQLNRPQTAPYLMLVERT